MKLSKIQEVVQACLLKQTPSGLPQSVLLVAPTGIGKTLAATADLSHRHQRVIYGVPLRGLASGIAQQIREIRRNESPIDAVVHHGGTQESYLFGEEAVVTTYDQIVCAVPGLPLSLPLSAGHAVAGALLMSRLILDEVHLAWSISPEALKILFAIVDRRRRLGVQTVVMTATMPADVAKQIAEHLELLPIIAGEGDTNGDEALELRNSNRKVHILKLPVGAEKAAQSKNKTANIVPIVKELSKTQGKRIYFANTVDRLQSVYDRLVDSGVCPDTITVLHNRMPRRWRQEAEARTNAHFGKHGSREHHILLTNQVAEAGLDISAPFVLSDPAPVDTLIQRAGRCARWFRDGETQGCFTVAEPKAVGDFSAWCRPYDEEVVRFSLGTMPEPSGALFSWETEKQWIDKAWLLGKNRDKGDPKRRLNQVQEYLDQTSFALNLFDRASQQSSPGAVQSVFREILSVEVAVVPETTSDDDLCGQLASGGELETCSIELSRAYSHSLKKSVRSVIRRREEIETHPPTYFAPGDLLLVPPSAAFLHRKKGLCFGDGRSVQDALTESEVLLRDAPAGKGSSVTSNPQSLWAHTQAVMHRVRERLFEEGDYRTALSRVLTSLEGPQSSDRLLRTVAQLAVLATGFHDLGKCGTEWQRRAREIDPHSQEALIGRTASTAKRMGVSHTPYGYYATVAVARHALGGLPEADHLIRCIALAAARHHSSLLDPSRAHSGAFIPVPGSLAFVSAVLSVVGLASRIDPAMVLDAAQTADPSAVVPLMLPTDDLFSIYALIGRAILMSDREDASGTAREHWRSNG